MTERSRARNACFGDASVKAQNSSVLVVGAGGIGCELLKSLLLSGFGHIDLDTIDLSNLNRQFLFRKNHIKRPKALVAKETAQIFNDEVEIRAIHGNIKDPQYGFEWFSSFDVVFNALDNLDARRHVNRMCLATQTPLIESGTTGFHGQIQVILKDRTECYDCTEKQTPKTFPVCTIRSTPSQPIHCVVWAKSYLLPQIFGVDDEEVDEIDNSSDKDNEADEISNLVREANELKSVRASMAAEDFARRIFDKVFVKDIERLRSMTEMWTNRRRPELLSYDELVKSSRESEFASSQRSGSLGQDFKLFEASAKSLARRMSELQVSTQNRQPAIEFDKDDEDVMNFVAATANLRSQVFDITRNSQFEIKSMAGNIIPAIATTNAIIAGKAVLEGLRLLSGSYKSITMTFLSRRPERVFNFQNMSRSNPKCPTCSAVYAPFRCQLENTKISDIVELSRRWGYSDEISIVSDRLFYDVDFDDNVDKTLQDLQVNNRDFVTLVEESELEDNQMRPNLSLVIIQDPTLPERYIVPDVKVELREKPASDDEPKLADPAEELPTTSHGAAGQKRKADESLEPKPKKNRITGDEILITDGDESNDVLVLD